MKKYKRRELKKSKISKIFSENKNNKIIIIKKLKNLKKTIQIKIQYNPYLNSKTKSTPITLLKFLSQYMSKMKK